MTKEELQEVYESRNWSEFSHDDIVGILDYLDDEDEDTIVDGYIKSSIKLLKKKIVEQSKYLKYDNIYKYVKKLSKSVEELEEIL